MTADILRVTVLQPELRWMQPMPNMHVLRQVAEKAAASAGTDVLVLPESFLGMPAELDETGQTAGQGIRFLATLAKVIKVHVVGGTIEHRDDTGRIYNSCFVFDPKGEQIARYDKRKLFSLECESRTPGKGACVVEIGGWRVGLLICADLWHPELARELCNRVDLLCVPAKSSVPSERYVDYARHMWETLGLVRAMENGYPVVVSDWAEGRHEAKRGLAPLPASVPQTHFTAGAASVANPAHRPDVEKMQQSLPKGRPGQLTMEIDRQALDKFRQYRTAVGLLPEAANRRASPTAK